MMEFVKIAKGTKMSNEIELVKEGGEVVTFDRESYLAFPIVEKAAFCFQLKEAIKKA